MYEMYIKVRRARNFCTRGRIVHYGKWFWPERRPSLVDDMFQIVPTRVSMAFVFVDKNEREKFKARDDVFVLRREEGLYMY